MDGKVMLGLLLMDGLTWLDFLTNSSRDNKGDLVLPAASLVQSFSNVVILVMHINCPAF